MRVLVIDEFSGPEMNHTIDGSCRNRTRGILGCGPAA